MEKPYKATDFFEMGLRLLQADDCHNAIRLLTLAIDLDPDLSDAYGFRGLAYATLGIYEESMNDYNTALILDPSLEDIFYFRGMLHLELKQYEDAVNDFTAAIALKDYFSEAYFYRGICKGKLGDLKAASYDITASAQLGMREAQKILNEKGIAW